MKIISVTAKIVISEQSIWINTIAILLFLINILLLTPIFSFAFVC